MRPLIRFPSILLIHSLLAFIPALAPLTAHAQSLVRESFLAPTHSGIPSAVRLAPTSAPAASQPGSAPATTQPSSPTLHEAYQRLYPDRIILLDQPPPNVQTDPFATSTTASSQPAQTRSPDPVPPLLLYSAAQLDALTPATGKLRWRHNLGTPDAPILLRADPRRILLATRTHLFALAAHSGATLWRFGRETINARDRDPESIERWSLHALDNDRLYSATTCGRLTALGLDDGELHWRSEPLAKNQSIQSLLITADRLCALVTTQDAPTKLLILDPVTGQLRSTIPLDSLDNDATLTAAPNSRLLLITANKITCLDLNTAKPAWTLSANPLFAKATLLTTPAGLIISDNNRELALYNWSDGSQSWRITAFDGPAPAASPSTSRPPSGELTGCWTALSNQTALFAANNTLTALDAATGNRLWSEHIPNLADAPAPRLTNDHVVTVSPDAPNSSFTIHHSQFPPSSAPSSQPAPILPRWLIQSRSIRAGTLHWTLTTPRMPPPTAYFATDHILLLIDQDRLIAYRAD